MALSVRSEELHPRAAECVWRVYKGSSQSKDRVCDRESGAQPRRESSSRGAVLC